MIDKQVYEMPDMALEALPSACALCEISGDTEDYVVDEYKW